MSSKVAKASTVLVSAYSEKIVGAIVANIQVIKWVFFAKVVDFLVPKDT
jgi:hypothetical protein